MKIPYVTNGSGWTFFIKGRPYIVPAEDIRHNDIVKAVFANDNARLEELLKQDKTEYIVEQIQKEICERSEHFGNLKFTETITTDESQSSATHSVTYKTIKLPEVLSEKLISLWKNQCTDYNHYFKFIEKLLANPSERAREELYRFLSFKELPITEEGNFIAYKGVNTDLTSIHGNKKTRVLEGKVLPDGRILNEIGSTITVLTEDVDTDHTNYCSCGLHVGSYKYASSFGRIILAVEVNPTDVVSVPTDCESQKCRVSSYKVLNPIEGEFTAPEVNIKENKVVEKLSPRVDQQEHPGIKNLLSSANINKTREAIDRNIDRNAIQQSTGQLIYSDNANPSTDIIKATTISQLCGSVGRKEKISRPGMLTVLLRLGYNVTIDNEAIGSSIVRH